MYSGLLVISIFKLMRTLAGEATLSFSFLSPILSGVNSKKIAPVGANSFFSELTLILEDFVLQVSNQKVTKPVSL